MNQALPPILDVEDGLCRVLGERDLYFRILRRFLHDHGAAASQIRGALKGNDQDHLQEIYFEIEQLVCAVRRIVPEPADAPGLPVHGTCATLARPPADPAARVLLHRLAHLLRDGDGAAIDVLDHSANVLGAVLGMQLYARVAAAAHELDFEGALDALQPALSA